MTRDAGLLLSSTTADPPEPTVIWTRPFVTLFVTNFFLFSGFNMLLATMPIYLQGRGVSESRIGLIFWGYYVACIFARTVAGRLSQKWGELRALWFGLALAGLANAFFLAYDNFANYFLTRVLNGVGFGLASPLLIGIASKIIPARRLAEGLGYLALGAALSLAAGPLVGIKLAETFGFKINLLTVVGSLFLALAATLTLAKAKIPLTLRAAAPSRSARARFFPNKEVLALAFLMLLLGGGTCGIFTYLALYLDELKISGVGYFFLVAFFGIIVTRVAGGRIHDRFGHFFVITPSAVLIGLALLLLLGWPNGTTLIVAAVIYGLGMGAIFPSIQAMALTRASAQERHMAAAAVLNGYDIGAALSTALLGALAEFFHSYRCVYVATPLFLAVLLVFYNLAPSLARDRRN
ncbi:MAG: MFS transporter [Deltaproteobacteria bacterium]|jgi:MFS family permease|nr:MFS transporter [Deltaproteobacteria bacterium]